MKHLTVRHVTPDLARALKEEQRRLGVSLNQAVLSVLCRALGLEPRQPYENGLRDLAAQWTRSELEEFESNTAVFEQVDEELWQ